MARVELKNDSTKGNKVFNLYSNLDRFRREAFIRIPGVFNISNSKAESILKGQGEIVFESDQNQDEAKSTTGFKE